MVGGQYKILNFNFGGSSMNTFKIGNKPIGDKNQIFLIAEAGVNHNGDLSLAKSLIEVAVDANVDAIKFQTFKAERLLLKSTEKATYQKSTTNNQESFYEMIKKYELNEQEFTILKNYCEEKGLIFLSTPFDELSVELLDELNIVAYKVGSGDMNNFLLLKSICAKGKPILLSTGMATLEDVKVSILFIKSNKIKDIVIFQCTTNYPADLEEINLNVINTYQREFPNEIIGFSDHSLGFEASIGAAAKGAKVIEKHFTLDKNMEGPDHKASLNPMELKNWVKSIRNLEKTLGGYDKIPSNNEIEIAKIARKSLVSVRDVMKGEILRMEDITTKRPGTGIEPKFYNDIIGKKVKKNILKDTLIAWEDLE